MVENIIVKVEKCWSTDIFLRVVETQDCVVKGLTHSHTMTPFDTPGKQAF